MANIMETCEGDKHILTAKKSYAGTIDTNSDKTGDTNGKESNVGRIFYSVCLCGAYFIVGWTFEQTGVAILDMQYNTGVSFSQASLYLAALNIAQIFGALLAGVLYQRIRTSLLMLLNVMGLALAVTSIPWCTSFTSMLAVSSAHGFFGGSINSVVLAEILALWGQNARALMQVLYFLFDCGLILSPLSTTPFLADFQKSLNSTDGQTTTLSDTLSIEATNENIDSINISSDSSQDYNTSFHHINHYSSQLYIPYSISNGICLVVAFSFMLFLVWSTLKRLNILQACDDLRETNALSKKFKIVILVITGFIVSLDIGMEVAYGFFLTAFSVLHMRWTKLSGGFATSLLYASLTGGQFIGIFLAICCKPITLMILYITALCMANICFIFSGLYKFNIGFWLCCVFAGVGKAVVSPSLCTLMEESFFPVTGRIAAYVVISECLGSALNSFVIGYLMDNYSNMYLFYVLCTESFVVFILVLVLLKITNS